MLRKYDTFISNLYSQTAFTPFIFMERLINYHIQIVPKASIVQLGGFSIETALPPSTIFLEFNVKW